jgi:hypothetical protein
MDQHGRQGVMVRDIPESVKGLNVLRVRPRRAGAHLGFWTSMSNTLGGIRPREFAEDRDAPGWRRMEKAVDHSGRLFEMCGFSVARFLFMSVEMKYVAADQTGCSSPGGWRLPAKHS